MASTKYLIIHADDAGMAFSENKATQLGMLRGSISSTSLMVPCPWFYDMAQFFLKHTELDYGIHLTLTGEWKTYPFKPCLPSSLISSLVNDEGYFYPKRNFIRDQAKADEVYLELKRQIEIALEMGLKPSHLDSHMYTLGLRQDLIDIYQQLGKEFQLPILLSKELIGHSGQNPDLLKLPEHGCLESVFMASFSAYQNEGLLKFYDQLLDQLPDGLSILLIHPALESDEMDQITLDHPNFGAKWRAEDAAYFSSVACKERLKRNGIVLVDWKSPIVLSHLGA